MNMTITEFIEAAAHNKIIQLVVLAIVCDTVFGVLRAILSLIHISEPTRH